MVATDVVDVAAKLDLPPTASPSKNMAARPLKPPIPTIRQRPMTPLGRCPLMLLSLVADGRPEDLGCCPDGDNGGSVDPESSSFQLDDTGSSRVWLSPTKGSPSTLELLLVAVEVSSVLKRKGC